MCSTAVVQMIHTCPVVVAVWTRFECFGVVGVGEVLVTGKTVLTVATISTCNIGSTWSFETTAR